jgi:peptide/nickel transport system permease protein
VTSLNVRWVLRRVAFSVFVLWGAATLSFLGLHLLPGNPAFAIAGGGGPLQPSAKVIALVNRQYGFNRPLIVQYWHLITQLAQGHLGTSYQLSQPVTTVIGQQLWATGALALGAAVLGFALGLTIALLTAGRPWARAITNPVELLFLSMPSFWLGILLLTAFAFHFHFFPVLGNAGIRSLILPWVTLALPIGSAFAIVMRDGLDRALEQPFALTVRARGTTEGRLRFRHALRHALIPVTTMSAWTFGQLLGGVVVIETVFARQGIGNVTVTAVTDRDFPVVIGIVMLAAVAFVVINITVDVLYAVIDPRVRVAQ